MSHPGGKPSLYRDLPVKHECSCPSPVVYRDEDNDAVCFRCGQGIKTVADLERARSRRTVPVQ
jgi:hypothetical protein